MVLALEVPGRSATRAHDVSPGNSSGPWGMVLKEIIAVLHSSKP